jgi:DNA replication protein DnaC
MCSCLDQGVGKSFVACALAQKACRDGYSALYTRAQALIRDLAMAPLSAPERRDFLEICEDRYQVRSTILTSQLPVSMWHEQIGDPTLADGILDRLVHYAQRIEMRGDSMRENLGKPNTEENRARRPWDCFDSVLLTV